MEFVPLIALGALIYSLSNLVKTLQGGDFKAAATIVATYVVGVIAVLAFRESDFAASMQFGDYVLGELDIWGSVILGLTGAGAANVAYDALPIDTPAIGTSRSDAPEA